jgi:hypothetical protein
MENCLFRTLSGKAATICRAIFRKGFAHCGFTFFSKDVVNAEKEENEREKLF